MPALESIRNLAQVLFRFVADSRHLQSPLTRHREPILLLFMDIHRRPLRVPTRNLVLGCRMSTPNSLHVPLLITLSLDSRELWFRPMDRFIILLWGCLALILCLGHPQKFGHSGICLCLLELTLRALVFYQLCLTE